VLRRILNLVGWLGAALVVAALVVRFTKPELSVWYRGLAIGGLVCTLLYLLSQWREIARSFARRQTRYGAISLASIAVVLAMLVGINWIANRQSKRWDLTEGGQFTLSDQTRKVLAELPKPVRAKVFGRSSTLERYRDRLEAYDALSDRLSVQYIDIVRRPELAQQYQVNVDGTVVFEYDGRTEKVTSDSEQELTNAIAKVVHGRQPKVYFVQGHGEKDPVSSERGGYSELAAALRAENFAVEKLVLAQQTAVPDDADVVVVAGPRTDYLLPELEMLRAYLRRGGKLLVMVDPPETPDRPPLTNLARFLREWAVEVGDNVVVDLSPVGRLLGTGPSVPVAASYPAHAITEGFNVLTAYPLARSVSPITGVEGRTAQAIVETSPSSWAETDLKRLLAEGQAQREENRGDRAGPITLAVAVTATAADAPAAANGAEKPETRIVAVGDSDFAANVAIGVQGNRDLALNMLNWLARRESLIAIRPREPSDRRITMTADQQARVFWLTLAIIPGLLLLAGVQVWWRRR
jgi:ABC-type uncharacterized transport system involved in gliding motility auxiliary subunit